MDDDTISFSVPTDQVDPAIVNSLTPEPAVEVPDQPEPNETQVNPDVWLSVESTNVVSCQGPEVTVQLAVRVTHVDLSGIVLKNIVLNKQSLLGELGGSVQNTTVVEEVVVHDKELARLRILSGIQHPDNYK